MLSDKIWDLKFANFVVRHLRDLRKRKEQDFRCDVQGFDTVIKMDNNHIVEVKMPMRCGDYNSCKKCEKECVNHDWNNGYIDLLMRLQEAKHDRNMAILALLWFPQKFTQLAEYARLRKYANAKKVKYESALDKLSRMTSSTPGYDKLEKDLRRCFLKQTSSIRQMEMAREKLLGYTK
ncbi:MAG: hypothetical protein J6Y07_02430 [Alphaproteobacteria bacterium]|nr:hypothetical protein [Alphaproteobacteria bacterium]